MEADRCPVWGEMTGAVGILPVLRPRHWRLRQWHATSSNELQRDTSTKRFSTCFALRTDLCALGGTPCVGRGPCLQQDAALSEPGVKKMEKAADPLSVRRRLWGSKLRRRTLLGLSVIVVIATAVAAITVFGIAQPETVSEYLRRGVRRVRRGDYRGTISDMSAALRLMSELHPDPDQQRQCHMLRGVAHLQLHNDRRAAEDLSRAIDSICAQPDYTSKAIYFSPSDGGRYTVGTFSSSSQRADLYALRAVAYARLEEHQKAVDDWTCRLELLPQDARALSQRAIVFCAWGQWQKALADCQQARELEPSDAMFVYSSAYVYFHKGDYEAAIAECSKAIEMKPDYAIAYFTRGLSHWRLGELDKAQSDRRTALRLKPSLRSQKYE